MGYFDKDGNPISFERWAELYTPEYKRVDETTLVEQGVWISTVWLGMNLVFMPDSPPIIFETMVFSLENGMAEDDMDRYSTLEQAKAGHQAMVERCLAKRTTKG